MVKKNITIDDLAVMVQKGFDGTATKKDIMDLRTEMNIRFQRVDERFDKIEKLILQDHNRRIEKLEDQLKEVKETLAMLLK